MTDQRDMDRVSGRIRPIKWVDTPARFVLAQAEPTGSTPQYTIWHDLTLYGCLEGRFGPYDSLEEAKAAAEEDRRNRIKGEIDDV